MRTLLSIACLAALTGCAIIITPGEGDIEMKTVFSKDAIQGNGQVSVERRAIGSLSSLEMSGPVHVEVRVGAEPSLQVEADSNLLPHVRTDISGATLKVWVDGNVRTSSGMRVIYTTPQLSQIRSTGSGRLVVTELNGGALTFSKVGSGESQLSGKVGALNMQLNGSGNVNATALQSGNANLNLTGSGRLTLGQVSADALNINLRGSGELQASGTVNHLNAHVLGSGGANLMGLASQRADLTTNGSGDISARVQQTLSAQTNGSGRITVYGNPGQRNITGKNVHVLN